MSVHLAPHDIHGRSEELLAFVGMHGAGQDCLSSGRIRLLRALLPRGAVPQPAETGLLQPGFALGPQVFPGALSLAVPDFRISAPFQ